MGQESSQVDGPNHNVDGVAIKQDPGDKENEPQLTDYDSSAIARGPARKKAAKGVKGPKKRKKRASASLQSADDVVRASNTASPEEVSSSGLVNQRKAELEAKKKRLLAVATSAAGETISQYSDREGNESVVDERIYVESEIDQGPTTVQINPSKNLRISDATSASQALLVGKGPKKSKSRSSLAITRDAENDNTDEDSTSFQRPTPSPSLQVLGRQTESNQTSKKRRRSKATGKDSTIESRKKRQRHTVSRLEMDYSDENMQNNVSVSYDPDFDGPYSSGKNLSPAPMQDTCTGFTPINEETVSSANPVGELDPNVSNSSPRSGNIIELTSKILPEQPAARAKNGERRPAAKLRTAPVISMMSPAWIQSTDSQAALIDPALRDLDDADSSRIQQIGIYQHTNSPKTVSKPKRRLPVDEDFVDENAKAQSAKKFGKHTLKPKTPNRKTPRTKRAILRDESPDLDALSTPKRGTTTPHGKHSAKVVGRFTDEEIAALDMALLKHREMYELSELSQNQMIQEDSRGLKEFWNEICSVLPDRGRAAIQKICRRRYHNYGIRGKWTEEEDEQLREAYERFPKSWKQMGEFLHRHPEDVRDRWRNYVICGNNQKKSYWTEKEEINLRAAVGECIQVIRELKAAEEDPDTRPDMELVDWMLVSEKLGFTRSRLQCSTKWKQLTKLEDADDANVEDLDIEHRSWRLTSAKSHVKHMTRDDYMELLLAIRQSSAGREGKVRWDRLGDRSDNPDVLKKWNTADRKVAWKALRATVPGERDMKFQNIVTILIDNLPTEEEVHAQIPDKPIKIRGVPDTRPALRAAIEAHKQSLANMQTQKSVRRDVEVDPSLDHIGTDEFDPDVVEETDSAPAKVPKKARKKGRKNRQAARDVVRAVVEELFLDENSEYEGSIDLDAQSQHERTSSSGNRLRSPITFDSEQNPDAMQREEDAADSDSDELDEDIPARRPSERYESVDLDEF